MIDLNHNQVRQCNIFVSLICIADSEWNCVSFLNLGDQFLLRVMLSVWTRHYRYSLIKHGSGWSYEKSTSIYCFPIDKGKVMDKLKAVMQRMKTWLRFVGNRNDWYTEINETEGSISSVKLIEILPLHQYFWPGWSRSMHTKYQYEWKKYPPTTSCPCS